MLEFDEEMAQALEVIYGTRDVLRRRRLVLDALSAAPGERILDVGCGPGFFVAELLDQVGGEGFVAGVDPSTAMLALSARRVEGAPNVSLCEAPATALPFGDGAFDAAISVQVLEYVEDVPLALSELRRVIRPGGRVVLWDIDWETLSMHTADPARMARVLEAWDRHLMHRSLPRTLPRLLREAGFTGVGLEGHSFTTAELTPDAYGASLLTLVEKYLAGVPDFPPGEAAAWLEEQRALGDDGAFYCAVVQCCVTATR
jgi:ubiquinone/menaquinone biosynthesis C-methylase UbiE